MRDNNHQAHFSFNVYCLIVDNRVVYQVYYENVNMARYLEVLTELVIDFQISRFDDHRIITLVSYERTTENKLKTKYWAVFIMQYMTELLSVSIKMAVI